MATRAQVVAEARRWLGTRWRHQGRGAEGIDCAGLLLAVVRALDLLPAEQIAAVETQTAGYGRYPRGDALKRALDERLGRTAVPQPGDVLLMRFEAEPQHVALLASRPDGTPSLIHAYAPAPHRVIETIYDARWQQRTCCSYALPGVA
jgi:cell wall-associated NlpC family hydrolase